jgi:hypothetical protein
MTSPAFSLTASPAKAAYSPGQTALATVTDSGSAPVAVSVHLAELSHGAHGCGYTVAAPAWARLTGPSHFSLAPGHTGQTQIQLATNAPGGHVLAVEFLSEQGSGNVHVSAGVASSIVVSSDHVTGSPCVAVPAPPATTTGIHDAIGAAGGLLTLALALTTVVVWVRRKRRKTATASYRPRHGKA